MNYTIQNEDLIVQISSLGAQLNSLKKQNDNFEYLWNGDEKYWNRKAPVLFPIVGRLKDDSYLYEDEKYSMNQHGFARDKEFKVVEQNSDYIIFLLESDEATLKVYPFSFDFYLAYKLEDNKLVTYYKVINRDDKELLFSIGAHPAFNWPLESGKKDDYYFEFEFNDVLTSYKLEDGYVSNNKVSINLDEKKLQLNDNIFKDDALIFEDLKIKTISYKNRVDNRSIKLDFEEFNYLGLWSKPTGAPFVCIEPWCGIADFKDSNYNLKDKIGINTLKEKETFEVSFLIELN